MSEKKYLNEENYQKTKKKIIRIALIVLIIGLFIGGGLISIGIRKQISINNKYSENNKQVLKDKITVEEKKLKDIKKSLEDKGIKYNAFTRYDEGESYDLKIVSEALNPNYNKCNSNEYIVNSLTKDYCSYQNELNKITEHNKSFEKSNIVPYYMFGAFIIVATIIISISIYTSAKGREIAAFAIQQGMPLAKESIDEMTPTIAASAGDIAKSIKKGLNDADKEK